MSEQPKGWHDQVLDELRAIRQLLVRIAPPLPYAEFWAAYDEGEKMRAKAKEYAAGLTADKSPPL